MVFDLSEKVLIIQALVPEPYLGYLLLFSLIGGTAILTTGICWKVRLRSKNHKNKYTLLSALLIPLLMSTLIFSIMFFRDPWYQPAERLAFTKVTVDNTNPLTLSLTMKSFYMYEIYFDQASIKDQHELSLLPPVELKPEWVTAEDSRRTELYYTQRFLGQLPGGSEKVITLDFNTTLPTGNYAVWIHTMRYHTFVSPLFTIP